MEASYSLWKLYFILGLFLTSSCNLSEPISSNLHDTIWFMTFTSPPASCACSLSHCQLPFSSSELSLSGSPAHTTCLAIGHLVFTKPTVVTYLHTVQLISNNISPVCAVHIFLNECSTTEVWLTYQEPRCKGKCFFLFQNLPTANGTVCFKPRRDAIHTESQWL